jgi:chromosome segregation ATPase
VPQASSTPPPPSPALDVRERQFEILTEAVTALRQEVSRSYAHSQQMTQENQRLRALVAALKNELVKTRSDNKAIRSQLRTVEKRLREVRSTPPEPKAVESDQAGEIGEVESPPVPEKEPKKSASGRRPRVPKEDLGARIPEPETGGATEPPGDAEEQ